MDIPRPRGKNYTYSEDELDGFGEVLLAAAEIVEDDKIFRLVQNYLDEKSGKISRIRDLRNKLADLDLSADEDDAED